MALSAGAQNDPAAKAILDKVSAKFKTLKTVQADYTLNVTSRAGKNAGRKNGSIFLKNPKYLITEKSMEITSDGNKMWKYEPAANEVTVSDVDNSTSSLTPQKLFTNFYDKDFLYKLNSDAKGIQEIELTPIDKSKLFHKVIVFINKATQTIVSTKIFEKAGNRYTYTVSGMDTKSNIDDATFVFNLKNYPGMEVVDLR